MLRTVGKEGFSAIASRTAPLFLYSYGAVNLRASPINKDLSINTTLRQIHLAGQYL
jgi:hypothetical protein